jgi:hypothetical protein
MENVDYVRVRSADPQARFQAERAERYEERRVREVQDFSFEQFSRGGEEINAQGKAGSASMEIDSGDIRLDNGVWVDVVSEDIAIETTWLEWKDAARSLTGGPKERVSIYQEDGTTFSGIGFYANVRKRTWEFSGSVGGAFVFDDDDEENEKEKKVVVIVEEENGEISGEISE